MILSKYCWSHQMIYTQINLNWCKLSIPYSTMYHYKLLPYFWKFSYTFSDFKRQLSFSWYYFFVKYSWDMKYLELVCLQTIYVTKHLYTVRLLNWYITIPKGFGQTMKKKITLHSWLFPEDWTDTRFIPILLQIILGHYSFDNFDLVITQVHIIWVMLSKNNFATNKSNFHINLRKEGIYFFLSSFMK